ncbi:MAG: class I adenylate-forming enzyme family protein, partial [Bacteroidaceae bacterium]|nr:class I adenylate-forming enzyme family protein [Bacteroidaceae bacterium]
VINVGGYKVAPTDVENVALTFPSVADCICVPVEHPITGKALKLLVVPADGAGYSPKPLALFLKSCLQPYQVPLFYQQVERIERTPNGKLNRRFYAGK